jgi:hypothetical protein
MEDRQESPADRLDREHPELFGELRAIIPGVQVMFGFLLSVAFTERFERLSDAQYAVYFGVFFTAAGSLALLLAPAAFHRVRFRQRDKEAMMLLANREATAAMTLLGISLAGVAHLITSFVLGAGWSLLIAGTMFLGTMTLWWAVPLRRRWADDTSPGPPI